MSGLLGVGQPGIVLHVLVADQLRPIDDGPRLEVAGGAIGGGRRELGIGADEPLGDPRSVGRGKELLFVDEEQLGVDEAHARHGERRLVELHQECRLDVERHVERVALEGAGPRGDDLVGVGQDDFARGEPGVRARDGDGLLGRDAGRGRLDAVRRGEAPGAVHEDAQAEAVARRPRDVLDLPFTRGYRFPPVAVDADVGVGSAERGGARQCRVGGLGAHGVNRCALLKDLRPRGNPGAGQQGASSREEPASRQRRQRHGPRL